VAFKVSQTCQAKIDRHIAYIDNKLVEYTRALAENDGDNKQVIEEEIKKQQKRKDNYKNLEKQLKESGEAQISISDCAFHEPGPQSPVQL
jgi:cob(I)alamin adenosyltransferase